MKILVALDGSTGSLVARDLVASLAWAPGTQLTMLTAYEVPIDREHWKLIARGT